MWAIAMKNRDLVMCMWCVPRVMHAWRNEIASVGAYSVEDIFLCSGAMIHDASSSGGFLYPTLPYFLTAHHCPVDTTRNAHTAIVYWTFETTVCGGDTPDGPCSSGWQEVTWACLGSPRRGTRTWPCWWPFIIIIQPSTKSAFALTIMPPRPLPPPPTIAVPVRPS